ncbi:MAG: ferrous iron transport protein A [Lentisphaerae bacterium]|jgi:Fe2+ transport system protein FeoA|nr:ferrous iron transport protein A [Lentisphaerota bacterium]
MNSESFNPAHLMPLSLIPTGHSVVLRRVGAGDGIASRLAAMGVLPGTTIEVRHNDRHGPIILGVNGGRVMLGRGMASKMSVQDS